MKSTIVNDLAEVKANSIVIDLDKGYELIENFIQLTKHELTLLKKLQIKVDKLNEKIKKKKYLEFGKEFLYPKFKKHVFDNLYPKDIKYNMNEILIYVIGIFSIYHAEIEIDKKKAILNSLKEMTDIVFKVKNEEKN